MSYNGYKGRYRSSPGNPAPEPGWGRLVPSRKDTFAGYGDEPSPPRFRGRPLIAYAALCTFVMAFTSSAPAASLPADWQHEQRLDVSAPGLLKLSLPLPTLDAARPALEDLRLYDNAGMEVPYLIERPRPVGRIVQAAKSFQVTVSGDITVLTLETGLTQPLDGVTLETPSRAFLKAVQIEGSTDGRRWETLAWGQPIFREPGGASQLHLAVPAGAWQWLRLDRSEERR